MNPLLDAIIKGLYIFFASWLLAQMEIQIEGPYGWAEKIPTWRISPPWLLRLTNGKPLTGYHFYLFSFLITAFHLPLLFSGYSRAIETKIISYYFIMAVTWDFQWFVWNPFWGTRRFLNDKIWWFPKKVLSIPIEYYLGICVSFVVSATLGAKGIFPWIRIFVSILVLTGASIIKVEWDGWKTKN